MATLMKTLGALHSKVSQHLAVLQAHSVVGDCHQGRRIFCRLCSPALVKWLDDGMQFAPEAGVNEEVESALQKAKLV